MPVRIWRIGWESIGVSPLSRVSVSPSGVIAVNDPTGEGVAIVNMEGRFVGWLEAGRRLEGPLQWVGDTLMYSIRGEGFYRRVVVEGRAFIPLDGRLPGFDPLPAASPFTSRRIVDLRDEGRGAIIYTAVSADERGSDLTGVRGVYWYGIPSKPLDRMLWKVYDLPCKGEVVSNGIANPACAPLSAVSGSADELRLYLLDVDLWDEEDATFRVIAIRANGDTAYVMERDYLPQKAPPASDPLIRALASRFPMPPVRNPVRAMVAGNAGEVWLHLGEADGASDHNWLMIDRDGVVGRLLALPEGAHVLSTTKAGEVIVRGYGGIEKYRLAAK